MSMVGRFALTLSLSLCSSFTRFSSPYPGLPSPSTTSLLLSNKFTRIENTIFISLRVRYGNPPFSPFAIASFFAPFRRSRKHRILFSQPKKKSIEAFTHNLPQFTIQHSGKPHPTNRSGMSAVAQFPTAESVRPFVHPPFPPSLDVSPCATAAFCRRTYLPGQAKHRDPFLYARREVGGAV